jgi:hypothetical protein
MIAPDSQRHAIARVREIQLAVGLLLPRHFRSNPFDLDVDARFHGCAVLRMSTNFSKAE